MVTGCRILGKPGQNGRDLPGSSLITNSAAGTRPSLRTGIVGHPSANPGVEGEVRRVALPTAGMAVENPG